VADTNPREGFADLFATHPSVQSRVDALVKFAGGHDPGPLAPEEAGGEDEPASAAPLPRGPWNDAAGPAGAPSDGTRYPLKGPRGRHV
jgi:heat shock protein HtpX